MSIRQRLFLTEKHAEFLRVLKASLIPLCGVGIVDISEGKVSRGSVFAIAAALSKDHLIMSTEGPKNPDTKYLRHYYTITERGKIALRAWEDMKRCPQQSPDDIECAFA